MSDSPGLLGRAAALLPYPTGTRVRVAASRSRLLRALSRRGALARLDRLLAALPGPFDREDVVRRHLLASTRWPWTNWAMAAVERRPLAELRPWFEVAGLDELERARAAGRGVVLANAHLGASLVVPELLARLGVELASIQAPGVGGALAPADAARLERLAVDPGDPGVVRGRALAVLRGGGVLHVAHDGFFGRGGLELPFLGRRRTFRAGFAAVAAEAGAAVLPLRAPLDAGGRAHVRIGAPLAGEPVDGEPDPDARAASLVRRLAADLEEHWRRDPGNVHAEHVRHVLELPPA